MKLTPLLTLSVFTAALTQSPAAIIVVAPTASTPGSIQITDDIGFTITAAGAATAFILDEWVVFDGTQSQSSYSPSLAISLNGGAPGAFSGSFFDNFGGAAPDVTANDGLLFFNSAIGVAPGNTLTLKAGLYSIATLANFNPQATQTFTGNMFVVNVGGVRISGTTAVPEPTALGLLGIGSLALLRRRRS